MASPAIQRDRITDHRKGLLVAGAGALLMTLDVPLVRLADSDAWTVIFFRGFCVFVVSFLFWWWLKKFKGYRVPFINGVEGFAAGALFAVTNISFMIAIHNTTAANAVFILAFAPLLAAVLSRAFMSEPIAVFTWVAIATAIGGMLIIALDGLGTGQTRSHPSSHGRPGRGLLSAQSGSTRPRRRDRRAFLRHHSEAPIKTPGCGRSAQGGPVGLFT